MSAPITVVSSMATKTVLAELVRAFEARSGRRVTLESIGGVEAAERVRAGELFDVVVLVGDTIDDLLAAGHLLARSKVDLLRSTVAVAVRAGTARPEIGSEDALKRAVLAARFIGYSTGPSGAALAKLFERWGIAEEVRARIVVAPPGVPVGALLTRGEVELAFQQVSELLHLEGIDVLGPLPVDIQIVTTFAAAVGAASNQPESAGALVAFLASPASADAKRRQGMEPA